MNITLENISAYTAIISLVVGLGGLIIKYVVVKPLSMAISSLSKTIEDLNEKITMITDTMNNYRERLAMVESSAKQAHHRIDRLEGVVDRSENA